MMRRNANCLLHKLGITIFKYVFQLFTAQHKFCKNLHPMQDWTGVAQAVPKEKPQLERHMLNKVAGLASGLAIILSVVAGFVTLPFNLALTLLVLGLVAGLCYASDNFAGLALMVLVAPAVATGLGGIPAVGAQLGAIVGNLALAAGGVLATRIIIGAYEALMGNIKGLSA